MQATFGHHAFQGDDGRAVGHGEAAAVIGKHLNAEGTRFLDCGCGIGGYVQALVEEWKVDAHGLEYDARTVAETQLNPVLRNRITQGDLQAIPSAAAQWDYAMLNEVLEHVGDERRVLREVHRVLKPGGRLFIFSPNRWFPFETHCVNWRNSARQIPHWVPFIPWVPARWGEDLVLLGPQLLAAGIGGSGGRRRFRGGGTGLCVADV